MMYGRINAYVSREGGNDWREVNDWIWYYFDRENNLHADIMYIDEYKTELNEPFVVISHHGGISTSIDEAYTTKNISLEGLRVTQYYDVKTLPTNSNWIFAGSQDQGFQRANNTGGLQEFDQILGGDFGHLTFTENQRIWIMFPLGEVFYYENPLSKDYPTATYKYPQDMRGNIWLPPMTKDPSEFNTVVAAGPAGENKDAYLIKMTPAGIGDSIFAETLPFDFSVSNGKISAIEIDETNPNRWYVGTSNGKLYRSFDGGNNFTETVPQIPQGHHLYGSDIFISKEDPNVVYIAGSGYSNAPVIRSTDGGTTFEEFSEGLPNTVVFGLDSNADGSLIFAAAEAGPYVYIKHKARWYDMSEFVAPNQTFWSVEYIENKQIARFGTFGRGIWDFEVQELVNTKDLEPKDDQVTIFPNPVESQLNVKTNIFGNISHYAIISSDGNLIFGDEIQKTSDFQVPAESLPAGIYFLRLKHNGNYIFKKFVKI